MAIYWLPPGFKGRTFKLCVLTRWDFNFCVRSSPLREQNHSIWQNWSVCFKAIHEKKFDYDLLRNRWRKIKKKKKISEDEGSSGLDHGNAHGLLADGCERGASGSLFSLLSRTMFHPKQSLFRFDHTRSDTAYLIRRGHQFCARAPVVRRRPSGNPFMFSVEDRNSQKLILHLVSGIKRNPRPPCTYYGPELDSTYPCGIWYRECQWDQMPSLACDRCNQRFHRKRTGCSIFEYYELENCEEPWQCPRCTKKQKEMHARWKLMENVCKTLFET